MRALAPLARPDPNEPAPAAASSSVCSSSIISSSSGSPLFLAVDGGGSGVRCVISSCDGERARASAGPCNAKGVSASVAVARILRACYGALALLPEFDAYDFTRFAAASSDLAPAPILPFRIFQTAWVAIAGVQPNEPEGEFERQIKLALHMPHDDLRITNDGHLLAAPSSRLPHIESCIGHVAGTGTISLAFRHSTIAGLPQLVGISGGWGYLLGDEGSAYAIGRLSIRFILTRFDSMPFTPLAGAPSPLDIALIRDLFAYFGTSTPADLIDRVYRDHSISSSSSFFEAESQRKIWFAESARITLSHAFSPTDTDCESAEAALAIATEALSPLVDVTTKLLERNGFDATRSALSLGGGLWKVDGYRDLLVRSLRERDVEFGEVIVVHDAVGEGSKALAEEWKRTAVH